MAYGTFDIEQYQLELSQARQEYGVGEQLQLARFDWNPADHPRDLFGKFRDVLSNLNDGESVRIPHHPRGTNGTWRGPDVTVKKWDSRSHPRRGKGYHSGARFTVDADGEVIDAATAENAADAALDAAPNAPYKSKINKVAKAIKPWIKTAIDAREQMQRNSANAEIINVAIKTAGAVVSANKKRDVLSAFGAFMADTYKPSRSKARAKTEREIATWLVDKLFDKIDDLTADQGEVPLADLNLSQWYG
jgi:hypothetical protein